MKQRCANQHDILVGQTEILGRRYGRRTPRLVTDQHGLRQPGRATGERDRQRIMVIKHDIRRIRRRGADKLVQINATADDGRLFAPRIEQHQRQWSAQCGQDGSDQRRKATVDEQELRLGLVEHVDQFAGGASRGTVNGDIRRSGNAEIGDRILESIGRQYCDLCAFF